MSNIVDDHVTAFLALLRADVGPPPLQVHDGAVPKGALPPYALVYTADDDPVDADATSLDGEAEEHVARFLVHCVGRDAAAARAVAARVRAAALNVRLAVPGRSSHPIRREPGQPMRRDESTGVLVEDKVDEYVLTTVPA